MCLKIKESHRSGGIRADVQINEINTAPRGCPMCKPHGVQNANLLAATRRYAPQTSPNLRDLSVVKESIRAFPWICASSFGDLDWFAAIGRHFPDLDRPGSCGTEIDPPAVLGPSRSKVLLPGVCTETPGRSAGSVDYIDLITARGAGSCKKGDTLAVGGP